MQLIVEELKQIKIAARQFLQAIPGQSVVCFDAPMGTGKTTFINALLNELQCDDLGSSPTYAIVNEYFSHSFGPIFHLDLYRLNSIEEAFDIGIEDILYEKRWCFIEWPELISNLLPTNSVWVKMDVNELQHRIISFEL
jgi:tRNA threonylcarbamoyladenosine biosynthesis protein TsaE